MMLKWIFMLIKMTHFSKNQKEIDSTDYNAAKKNLFLQQVYQ